jgi:hypothetical protein
MSPLSEAESLEHRVWEMLDELTPDPKEALHLLVRALHLRERTQGKGHPDLIWTLSLGIEVLRLNPSLASFTRAAGLGERRWALRSTALGSAPEELARSAAELADLYTFEGRPFNERRILELRGET